MCKPCDMFSSNSLTLNLTGNFAHGTSLCLTALAVLMLILGGASARVAFANVWLGLGSGKKIVANFLTSVPHFSPLF